MRALFLIGLILVTAPQAQSLAASDNNSWLPLSRSEIIQLTLGATNAETLKIETSDVQKANLTGFLPSDDTIWIVSNPAIPLTMVMAGRDQNVNSLRVTVPVVNYSQPQSDRVFANLVGLFKRLYPDWPDAAKWPTDSLLKAWHNVTERASADPDDQIIRKEVNGITNATFGIPPDLVVYAITIREQCVPNATRGDPFKRLIC